MKRGQFMGLRQRDGFFSLLWMRHTCVLRALLELGVCVNLCVCVTAVDFKY